MSSEIKWTKELGEKTSCKLTLYALSTCGFCKKALAFLKDNSVEFEYVYVDKMNKETRDKVVNELGKRFNRRVAFPFLIVDNKDCMVGFEEEKYRDLLDVIVVRQEDT